METASLLELRTAIINEASIDGQVTTTGRHTTLNVNALINRYCRRARAKVASAGAPWFQVLDTITPMPGVVANEDFIEIPFPVTALEIAGVDVQVVGNGTIIWRELDPADWTQRRLLNFEHATPPGGVGWWAIEQMPEARASASVTAGKIALFPKTLAGSYRVTYIEQFTDMTSDTHIFVGTSDMHTWVINSVAMVITKRDTNKKSNYAAMKVERDDAEAAMLKDAKRTQHAGAVSPMRIGGNRFG